MNQNVMLPSQVAILVVDDDPSVRNALVIALEDDYQVRVAATGTEAVAILDVSVRAVILDIKMKGKDGFWTYTAIRARFPHLPIVFFSAFQNLKDPYEIINEYRPFGYVRKGDDLHELTSMLAQAVSHYEQLMYREAQLAVADRLAAVGTLAAGAAHEINNPLAYISGNIEYSLHELQQADYQPTSEDGREIESALTAALEGAKRITRIVGDLSSFENVNTHPNDKNTAYVPAALELAIRMAANEIRHRAVLSTNFERLPQVYADENSLAQLFLNLLLNAAQALPVGQVDRHRIDIRAYQPTDESVAVEISDTGPGIPREVQSRMFDPFFTTKETGIGSGLGLFVSHNLVASFGGSLRLLASKPGVGTTFQVILRVSEDARRHESPSPEELIEPGAARRHRVLVVDDEPLIGKMLQRTLRDHDVHLVTCGRDAIELCRDQHFDVILCDVMMPDCGGMEVYQELLTMGRDQEQRIVFITGGVFEASVLLFLEDIANPTLKKPVQRDVLLRLVDEIARS